MLAAIKPQYFCDLNLNLPDIDKQRLIAKINLTAKRELYLLNQLREEKEKYYQACLEKLYKNQFETANQKEHENDNQK